MFKEIKLWMILAIIGAMGIAIITSHTIAYRTGVNVTRAEILKRSVIVLRQRGIIDAELQNSTDADLCRALGGLPNNGKCE